jgi:hypothetical protein
MNTLTRNSRFLIIVVLLSILSAGQLVYAQDAPDCTAAVPQWVKDRQQYETTYVYVPPASDLQPAARVSRIPQWVLDRQQYETTYVPPQLGEAQLFVVVSQIPQWVRDRQQYETSYTYMPPAGDFALADNRCSLVQASGS